MVDSMCQGEAELAELPLEVQVGDSPLPGRLRVPHGPLLRRKPGVEAVEQAALTRSPAA